LIAGGLEFLTWGAIDLSGDDFAVGRGFSVDWEDLARLIHRELPTDSLVVQEDLLAQPSDPGVANSFDDSGASVAVGQHVVDVVRVNADPLALVPLLRGSSVWQSPATVGLAAEVTPANLSAVLVRNEPRLVKLGLVSIYDGESMLIGRPPRAAHPQ
jgi:hypothetical protein